jgi:DNA (cytosine-5)-methyltransferase 1
MPAYYNEIDPFAAEWLKELIKQGHIAPGDVDTRSIEDVNPNDLKGYTQCHFFAGIGVWSLALRNAGWPDDRPVWTGSCPCQPFSAAGKGGGFTDERHLWPAFNHLIGIRRPSVVLGEQVASKDGLAWIDLVQADMEGKDYAFAAVDLCAAGFGAPNIRQRLYWVGHTDDARLEGWKFPAQRSDQRPVGQSGLAGLLAHASRELDDGSGNGGTSGRHEPADGSDASGLGDSNRQRARGHAGAVPSEEEALEIINRALNHQPQNASLSLDANNPGPVNGYWAACDWIGCTDGKWRPVEPGTQPLADGTPARVGRLRGYGNAINAEVAKGFVESVMECLVD